MRVQAAAIRGNCERLGRKFDRISSIALLLFFLHPVVERMADVSGVAIRFGGAVPAMILMFYMCPVVDRLPHVKGMVGC